MRYRLKVWTGPVYAVPIGRRMRKAGLKVVTGTEHVYVTIRAESCTDARHKFSERLRRKFPVSGRRVARVDSCGLIVR